MSLATAAPPADPQALRAFALELQAELGRIEAESKAKDLRIEKLEQQLAVLKRARFGRSSEKLDQEIEQLELAIGELQETSAEAEAREDASGGSAVTGRKVRGPKKPLPSHLPREFVRHEAPTACPACGSPKLSVIGEDAREVLEYVPAHFKVIVHVRPKVSCRACEAIAQAPAAPVPIERALPGPHLLAHIAVAKFCDHLPLYRQSEIYAREGVDLARATLAEWMGRLAFLVSPLAERIGRYVREGQSLHADDTTVPVLDPGRGRTKTGRLWALVRDERPFGSRAPPAVVYRYSADRKGEHARALLGGCEGFLHADGYAGFEKLFAPVPPANAPRLFEVACWAHARRKIYDVKEGSPAAEEALLKIAELFAIEATIAAQEPEARLAVRRKEALPRLAELKTFLDATLRRVSRKGKLAGAIRYATARWEGLTRFATDGRLEMTNNAAERAMRIPVLGRKNYLFAGSDDGGRRAATFYTLIGTAKLGGLDPEAWLADVAGRIADHPVSRLDELLPWNWRPDQAREPA
jgi:transposase